MPSCVRQLVLCADDFGLTAEICAAIAELGASGAISATSCLIDGKLTPVHLPPLPTAAPQLSIGLHLNLTENRAESPLAADLQTWWWRCCITRDVDTAGL